MMPSESRLFPVFQQTTMLASVVALRSGVSSYRSGTACGRRRRGGAWHGDRVDQRYALSHAGRVIPALISSGSAWIHHEFGAEV